MNDYDCIPLCDMCGLYKSVTSVEGVANVCCEKCYNDALKRKEARAYNGVVVSDDGDTIHRYGDSLLVVSDVVEIDASENPKRECDVECDIRSRIATIEKATKMLADVLAGDYIQPCQTKSYSIADYENALKKLRCQVDRCAEEIKMLKSCVTNNNENKKDAV